MSKKNSKANEPTEEQKRASELKEMKKTDPAALKADLFRLRDELRDIVKVKSSLEDEITSDKQKHLEETELIEANLKVQENMATEIENQFNSKSLSQEQVLAKLKRKQEDEQELAEMRRKRELEEVELEKVQLEKRVAHLNDYPNRRVKYEASMQELMARHEKMQRQQEKDIGNIKNQHQKVRDRLDQDTQIEIERIKSTEVTRLQKKLTREQFIKRENEAMEKEIEMCEQHKKVLEQECLQLAEQIAKDKSQRGDSILGTQANETYERSLRLIKLEGKLSKLKSYLADETARIQKEYDQIDNVYNKQFHELGQKVSKVEGWLRIKDRDLKKVKACSQMVLNQRNNLESYLLEVFYEHPELDYKEERNINKILRFLFAKINSKKPPANYKNFLNSSQAQSSINSSSMRS